MAWKKVKSWKGKPWEIYQDTETGRLRVDNLSHLGGSQYPVIYRPQGRPWFVAWDRPEVIPEYLTRAVFKILESREVRLAHDRAYGRGTVRTRRS